MSNLTKSQKREYVRIYMEDGGMCKLVVHVRYDDRCGNGHNSFSITGSGYEKRANGRYYETFGGCCHDKIAEVLPELQHLIKWHLCSSDGPMYYIENTMFHALQHNADMCHIVFRDEVNNLSSSSLKYCSIDEGQSIIDSHPNLYSMNIDEKTAKIANYDHARSSAIWPEATDEQLSDTDSLKQTLVDRLPALMRDFKETIENLGFVY